MLKRNYTCFKIALCEEVATGTSVLGNLEIAR
jgi:hypothetical protein